MYSYAMASMKCEALALVAAATFSLATVYAITHGLRVHMCKTASFTFARSAGHSEAKRSDGYIYIYIYDGGSVGSTRVGSPIIYIESLSHYMLKLALWVRLRSSWTIALYCSPNVPTMCSEPLCLDWDCNNEFLCLAKPMLFMLAVSEAWNFSCFS